jgi:hypothetical protein
MGKLQDLLGIGNKKISDFLGIVKPKLEDFLGIDKPADTGTFGTSNSTPMMTDTTRTVPGYKQYQAYNAKQSLEFPLTANKDVVGNIISQERSGMSPKELAMANTATDDYGNLAFQLEGMEKPQFLGPEAGSINNVAKNKLQVKTLMGEIGFMQKRFNKATTVREKNLILKGMEENKKLINKINSGNNNLALGGLAIGTSNSTPMMNENKDSIIGGLKNFMEPTEDVRIRDFFREVGLIVSSSERAFGQTIGDALATKSKDFNNALKAEIDISDANLRLVREIIKNKQEGKDTTRLEGQLKRNSGFKINDIIPSMKKSALKVISEGVGVALDIASAGSYKKIKPGLAKSRLGDVAAQTERGLSGKLVSTDKLSGGLVESIKNINPNNIRSTYQFKKEVLKKFAEYGMHKNGALLTGLNQTVSDFNLLQKNGIKIFSSSGIGAGAIISNLILKLSDTVVPTIENFLNDVAITNPVKNIANIEENVKSLKYGEKLSDENTKIALDILKKRNEVTIGKPQNEISGTKPATETIDESIIKNNAFKRYKFKDEVLPILKEAPLTNTSPKLTQTDGDIRLGGEFNNDYAGKYFYDNKSIEINNINLSPSTTAHEFIHLLDDRFSITGGENAKNFNEDWDNVKRELWTANKMGYDKDGKKIKLYNLMNETDNIIKNNYRFNDPNSGYAIERLAHFGDDIGSLGYNEELPSELLKYYKDIFNN